MNQLAIVKRDVIDVVSSKVKSFQENGEIHLPRSYSAENALKSAYLVLQGTVDRNKKPVLETCSQDSIANSLLDMIVQGLNPAKKQCYFIAYGRTLVCQRSYHGTMAITKNMCYASDITAQVVWGDDEFEYEIVRGQKIIKKHTQKIQNVGNNPLAAYCTIFFRTGKEITDIMTMDQIKASWTKSKMAPSSEKSTHSQFSEEMIRKTVINRACKKYINSSSDSAIFEESFNREDDVSEEEIFKQEVVTNANKDYIDIEPEPEKQPGVQQEKFDKPEKPIVSGNIGKEMAKDRARKEKPVKKEDDCPF